MWMMGYNDGGDLYMPDSINAAGRKLRPLVPRPFTAATSSVGAATVSTTPGLNRIHGADHLFLNNASMSEQNKREFNPQQVVVSSRWNPTPEQLRALEELYRRGTRTPSADQIQHITAQLRRYGKIEGKNVFYWFQNHKARERQKRRREMESDDHCNRDNVEILERKEQTGASRTVFGIDQQTKNWIPPINSSTLPEESTVCMQKAAKGAAGGSEVAECKSSEHHQWMKMDERVGNGGGRRELESQFIRRNDTWQAMQLSCPAPTHHINTPKPPMDPKQLFNYKSANSNINSPHLTPFLLSSPPPPPPPEVYNIASDDGEEEEEEEEEDADHHHHYDHFRHHHHHFIINNRYRDEDDDDDDDDDNAQTLELFPLRSGDFGHEKDSEMSLGAINNGFNTPHQFFEFLPMKN